MQATFVLFKFLMIPCDSLFVFIFYSISFNTICIIGFQTGCWRCSHQGFWVETKRSYATCV